MNIKKAKKDQSERLSDEEAEAGAPENYSIAGEEDPGVALEQWVEEQKKAKEQTKKSESESIKKDD